MHPLLQEKGVSVERGVSGDAMGTSREENGRVEVEKGGVVGNAHNMSYDGMSFPGVRAPSLLVDAKR